MTAARFRLPALRPLDAALGALIRARTPDLGVHAIEVADGQFGVVSRLSGPYRHPADALRAATGLAAVLAELLGPDCGARNPRPVRLRLMPPPARKVL